jgi:hypothetical protein
MNILAGICRGSAKIALSSALFLGAAFSGHADTYYVDASALANGADGTEQRPFPTIQAAVDAASANDTIRVAAGRYSASSGRVEDDTACESVVIVKNKKLHIIGAGRGKSVIAGSRDPAAGAAYASHVEGDYAVRCAYVAGEGSAGTIIEGFTLCDGETLTTGSSAGCGNAGGGLYADSTDVYLVDCDVVHCAGKYGSPIHMGTAVRCLFDDNYGTGGPGGYRCRLVNCVVTRSVPSGGSTGTFYKSALFNCTVVDNATVWALQTKEDEAYNSIFILSVNTLTYRETNVVNAVVKNCVLASQAPKVNVQLMGPAVGDWRLLADSDAVGAADRTHLDTLNLPPEIDAYADFSGEPIVPDGTGRFNAGAIQATATPAAGALWFSGLVEVNGRESRNGRAATYVYPDTFPTQYCVRAVRAERDNAFRLTRYDINTGNTSPDYPSMTFQRDGRIWLMPPPRATTTVTNSVKLAESVLWVDAENGKDEWGSEAGDIGSETHPYASIQAAIEAASSDFSLIKVKPGKYASNSKTVDGFGEFRVCLNGKSACIRAIEGPEHTFICGRPDPDTQGLGPKAVKCVYIKGRNAYLQGFTIADGYSHGESASDGEKKGSAVNSVDTSANSSTVSDCVITNCHAYDSAIYGTALIRCRVYDCRSENDPVVDGGYVWGCHFRGCVNARQDSSTTGILNCDSYQSTFVGIPNSGRLCGGGGVSYNSIWDGGLNVYSKCVFTNSITWNVKNYNNNGSRYIKADPCFVDRTADGVLRSDSPAVGKGYCEWDSDFGDRFWRIGGGDANGDPIVFTDGAPTAGAFQRTRNFASAKAETPKNGGWRIENGEYGDLMVYEGGAGLRIVPAEGTRPCIGVSCGGKEHLFTNAPGETVILDYGILSGIVDPVVTGIYSTDWYVDDDGSDDNTGFLPTRPKKILAEAAALLSKGDTLWVFPGTYSCGTDTSAESENIASRVRVKEGTSVVSLEGPEKTVITGGNATIEASGDGCGTNAIRCARIEKNGRLSGFTLTGGRVNPDDSEPDSSGAAVLGAGRDQKSIVDNCIISNNISKLGTVMKSDLFDSMVLGNVTYGHGVGVRQGNAYNSLFRNNTGDSVTSYARDVIGCTITGDNLKDNGKKSNPVANLTDKGKVYNCILGGDVSIKQSGSDFGNVSNCVCNITAEFSGNTVTGNVQLVDFTEQSFIDGVIPVAGANDAVDKADESLATNLYSKTDLRGFQRVMNGRLDIGAYEADWRESYAAALFPNANLLSVESASRDVALVDGVLTIPCGKLEATWRNPTGRNVLCTMPVRVVGSGELTVMLDGETLGVVRESDGDVSLSFVGKEDRCAVSFSYEPGDGDVGYAVLGAFVRSRMNGLVFTVR